jgi:hypothetical protein
VPLCVQVLDAEEALLKSPAGGGHPARPRAGVPCASPTRSSPAPSRMGPGRAVQVAPAVQQRQGVPRAASLPPRPPASPFRPPPLIIGASSSGHCSGSSSGESGSSTSGRPGESAPHGQQPWQQPAAAVGGGASGAAPFEHGGPSDDEARAHGAFMAHLSQQTAQLKLARRGAGSSVGCGGAGGGLPVDAAAKAAAVRRLLR